MVANIDGVAVIITLFFLFQISGDVGEQVSFFFAILPRTSPTTGRSLPVGCHLVVIQ